LSDCSFDLRSEFVAATELARISPDRKSALFKRDTQFLYKVVVSGGVGDEDVATLERYRLTVFFGNDGIPKTRSDKARQSNARRHEYTFELAPKKMPANIHHCYGLC